MWRGPECLVIRDSRLKATASRLAQVERSEIFCESEADSTSETGVGQFSIFGAVEEKSGSGFLPEDGHEVMGETSAVAALDGGVLMRGFGGCARRVECGCGLSTGSAQEMQKGVGA
jgi:hypothetical protein